MTPAELATIEALANATKSGEPGPWIHSSAVDDIFALLEEVKRLQGELQAERCDFEASRPTAARVIAAKRAAEAEVRRLQAELANIRACREPAR